MAEMQTDAAALSSASMVVDGISSFFLFEDGAPESRAGMQDTEKGVGGMFVSAGDAGGQAVQKLAGIWGGSGSDAYQQTQQRWDSTAADSSEAATKQINELNTISENINRSGTQYQQAADDAASTLISSMGFTPPDDGFDFKAAQAGEAAGYQAAADDAASSLQGSMGSTPPDDGFDLKAAEPGEAASDALSYNFSGIEGAASTAQPDTDGGWLLGDGGNGGIPATMAEWALLLA